MARQKSRHVDSPAAVGQRIRELRTRRGLRQIDLSFPGCTPAYISRIEAGARIPSLQLLREIGKRLGVSADVLAGRPQASAESLALTDAQLAQRLGDLSAAREAFGRLVESEEPDVRAAALLGLGQLALHDGEVVKAIELLEEHERLAGAGGQVDAAWAEALAHAYSARGDLGAAVALLERKLELAEDDVLMRFRIAVLLANALIDLGSFDRAELLIADSRAELGSAPDPFSLARCLWSQSRLQTARGNMDLAIRYAEEALGLIKSTEHQEYAARAHHLLAHIELQRGNAARALDLLDEALPLVERSGDQRAVATSRLERARSLVALGRPEEAQLIASELILEVEHLSPVDAARSLATLARILQDAGDTDRALELYETAADALTDRQGAPMLIDLYTRWSDLLAETGDTARALEVARRALTARRGAVGVGPES